MKGSKGTQMHAIENGKVNKIKADCSRCKEYLQSNPLCKLGRTTSNNKQCKWYYSIKSNSIKIKTVKNKTVSANYCADCVKNEASFCLLHKRFTSFARSYCIETKGKVCKV